MYRTSSSNVGSGVRMLSQSQRGGASPARSPAPGSAAAPVKRMALSDFEKLVTIAKGSFGTVYKAVRKDNGRVYALKQVEIANMNRAEREEAVDEVRALDSRRVNATRQPKLFRETRLAFSVPKPPCPRSPKSRVSLRISLNRRAFWPEWTASTSSSTTTASWRTAS